MCWGKRNVNTTQLIKRLNFSGNLEKSVKEIDKLILQYNPLDLISNFAFINTVWPRDNFDKYENEPNPAQVEYLTLVCLTHSLDEFKNIPIRNYKKVLTSLQENINVAFLSQFMMLSTKGFDQKDAGKPAISDELRMMTIMHSMNLRYPIYPDQLIEELRSLFTPISNDLKSLLGFQIEEMLSIIKGIKEIIIRNINFHRDQLEETSNDLQNIVTRYREETVLESQKYDKEIIKNLAHLKPKVANERIDNLCQAWFFSELWHVYTFSPSEISKITKIEETVIEAFFTRFSLNFGEVSEQFLYPSLTNPLMRKPIIKLGDFFFIPYFQSIYYCIRPELQEAINVNSPEKVVENNKLFKKYEKIRATYLENKSLEYLKNILPNAESFSNLIYKTVDGNGNELETELDGLLMFDNALLLIEAKSGNLTDPARRGSIPRIKHDLDKLIKASYEQSYRARKYIHDNENPTFSLHDGMTIPIDKKRIKDYFLITVTLEDCSPFVTNAYKLEDLGYFRKNDFPWIVSLGDLQIISDLIEFPGQFVHYLKRRNMINEQAFVFTIEELDWFGDYLSKGLYFQNYQNDNPDLKELFLGPSDSIIDEYYFNKMNNQSANIEKPTQDIPEIVKSIILDLEKIAPLGYLDIVCTLLDMSGQSRSDFCDNYLLLIEKSKNDNQIHDATMPFLENRFGITIMTAPILKKGDLARGLIGYCEMKKYQTKFDKWLGFGHIIDAPGAVHMAFINTNKWTYDKTLEKIVGQNLPPLSPEWDQHD